MEETDNQEKDREDNRAPAPEAGHPDVSPGPETEPSAAQGTSGEETAPATQESPQKLSFKDELLLLFKKPSQAFKSIAANLNWGRIVVILILTSSAGYLSGIPPAGIEGDFAIAPLTYVLLIPLMFVLSIPLLLLLNLLGYGIAKLFKGVGTLSQTISVSVYSAVPLLLEWLIVPISVTIAFVRTPQPVAIGISSFTGLISFGITIWSFVLFIIGLRRIHRFGAGQAIGTACLPFFGCGCLILILLAALIMLGVLAGIGTLQGFEGM